MSKTVLISGASSGIGSLAAHLLADAGHTVHAGMRDVAGRNRAAAQAAAACCVPVAIAGSDDGEMRVWDLGRMRLYGQGLVGPEKGAESIAVLYDNGRTTVVSGQGDGTLSAWNP